MNTITQLGKNNLSMLAASIFARFNFDGCSFP